MKIRVRSRNFPKVTQLINSRTQMIPKVSDFQVHSLHLGWHQLGTSCLRAPERMREASSWYSSWFWGLVSSGSSKVWLTILRLIQTMTSKVTLVKWEIKETENLNIRMWPRLWTEPINKPQSKQSMPAYVLGTCRHGWHAVVHLVLKSVFSRINYTMNMYH